MTAARTASQRGASNRRCRVCGAERPPGRRLYCSEECNLVGTKAAERTRQTRRMQACTSCGKAKEPGIRGSRLCAACREANADAYADYERQRGLARVAASRAQRLAAGERISRRNDAPEGTRWCAMCQEFRPLQVYTRHKSGKWAAYCKPCTKAYNHERRLRTVFGISFEEYEALMQAQDGRCAICLKRPRKLRLAVDHNHQTNEIRGLLCGRCNHKLLGAADESPERLRRAADYLDTPPARSVLRFGADEGKAIPVTRIVTREVAAYLAANGFPHAEPAPDDVVDGIPGITIRVREDGLGLADDKAAEWLAREPGLMVVRRHKAEVQHWRCWMTFADLAAIWKSELRSGVNGAAAGCMELGDVVPLLRGAGYGTPVEEAS